MTQYAVKVVEDLVEKDIDKVLESQGKKGEEEMKNLIERVFEVRFDNEGNLTPDSLTKLESLSLRDSLEKMSSSFENIDMLEVTKIYRDILERVDRIENYLDRTHICDNKMQRRGNSILNNGKLVKLLRSIIDKTREKIDRGIALNIEISFIISDFRRLLNDAMHLGDKPQALEKFCQNIDSFLPASKIDKINQGQGLTIVDKLALTSIAELLRTKLAALGNIGIALVVILCGIGAILIAVAVIVVSIVAVLLGIIGAITGSVGMLFSIPILGSSRKMKLNALIKELEDLQGSLDWINKQLEIGLDRAKQSCDERGHSYSILLQAYNDFKGKIDKTQKTDKYKDSNEEEVIAYILDVDSTMGGVTTGIQERFSIEQKDAWKILMFIDGCTKLENEGVLTLIQEVN